MVVTSVNTGGLLPAAKAEEIEPRAAEPVMKLVQSDFDSDTSILSMDLMVKPQSATVPGANEVLSLSEGYIAFSYDTNAMVLQTDPSVYNEKTGNSYPTHNLFTEDQMLIVGGYSSATLNDFSSSAVAANDMTYSARRIESGATFSTMMSAYEYVGSYPGNNPSTYESGDFDLYGMLSSHAATALIVSTNRGRSSDNREARDMADAYFHFRYKDMLNVQPKPENNGYVKVVTFKFLLISGQDESFNYIPAGNTDGLYMNSIKVPKSSEEAAEILDEFHFSNTSGVRVDLASGAAGIKELKAAIPWTTISDLRIDTITHYYDAPKDTPWILERGTDFTRFWQPYPGSTDPTVIYSQINAAAINKADGVPYVEYDNSEREYIVDEFFGMLTNTYGTNEATADFVLPADELQSAQYPRYSVPRYDDEQAWDEDEEAGGNRWIPWMYQYKTEGGRKVFDYKRKQPLKYDLSTAVSASSTIKPETSPEGGVEKFLEDIKWEINLSSTTLPFVSTVEQQGTIDLDKTVNVDAPFTVPTQEGDATVQKMRVTGPETDPSDGTRANPYLNKLFQKVTYNPGEEDEYVQYTPLGVTYDMVESDILITDIDGNSMTVRGKAPQLNIRTYAVDVNNILWAEMNYSTNNEGNGLLYLTPTYVDDFTGKKFETLRTSFKMRIYKDQFIPSRIDMDLSGIGTTFNDDIEETVSGITLATGEPDIIAEGTATVTAKVYDQYGIPVAVTDETRPRLSLKHLDGTEQALPIVMMPNPSNLEEYILRYEAGRTINNVRRGNYLITAKMGTLESSAASEDDRIFFVNKEANRLGYVDVSLGTGTADGDTTVISYVVPRLVEHTQVPGVNTITARVTEIANQWRNPDDWSQFARAHEYDVADGIRTVDNTDPANPVYSSYISYGLALEKDITIDTMIKLNNPGTMDWTGIEINGVMGGRELLSEDGYYHPTESDISIRYDSRVKHGTKLDYIVRVTYKGETLQKKYRFEFNRAASVLSSMELRLDSTSITVPSIKEFQANGATKASIIPIGRDQYGTNISWGDLLVQGYRYDFEFTPALNSAAQGTSGINYVVENYPGTADLRVDSTAKNVNVKIRAGVRGNGGTGSFEPIHSNEVTVMIRRDASYPERAANPRYSVASGIFRPPTNAAGQPEENSFSVTNLQSMFFDQYEAQITTADCGDITWSIESISGELTRDEIRIDETTGTIYVKKNAHNGRVSLRLRVEDKTKMIRIRNLYTDYIEVQRAPSTVQNVDIIQTPTTDTTLPALTIPYKTMVSFSATGTDQYGDEIQVSPATSRWVVTDVTFEDSSLGFIADASGNVFVDDGSGTQVFRLTNAGILTYQDITEWKYVPKAIKVRITAVNGVADEQEFTVIFKPESVPSEIYVNQELITREPIIIPATEDPTVKTKTVTGDVRNQYGIILPDAELTWSLKEILHNNATISGVTFDPATATVSVTNAATPCEVILLAEYEEDGKTISREVSVNVQRDGSVPTTVRMLDLASPAGANSVYLSGFDATTNNTYTIMAEMLNQYDEVIGGIGFNWTVEDVYYLDSSAGDAKVSFMDKAAIAEFRGITRILIVKAAQGVVDQIAAGNRVYIEVKATATDASGVVLSPPKTGINTLEILLAQSKPYYSDTTFTQIIPERTMIGTPDEMITGSLSNTTTPEGDAVRPPWVYLPRKNEKVQVKISGVVYDQYKRAITAPVNPGDDKAMVKLDFPAAVNGFGFVYDSNTGTGTLTVDSIVTGRTFAPITSVPLNNQNVASNLIDRDSVTIVRSRNVVDGLFYGTVVNPIEDMSDFMYELEVPLWATRATANVPSDTTTGEPLADLLTYENSNKTDAFISNQYGSEYSFLLPKWSEPTDAEAAEEDYTGIELKDLTPTGPGDDVTTPFVGHSVYFEINNKTLAVDERLREVRVQASAVGKYSPSTYEDYDTYPELQKTAKVQLRKGISYRRFMYVEGVDRYGNMPALVRPHVKADNTVGSASVTINPEIYDQYGFIVGEPEESTVDLIPGTVESQGAAVENVTERAPVSTDPDIIIGYKIYDSVLPEPETPGGKVEDTRVLLAEYTIETKKLTIYSPCDLTEIGFIASVDDTELGIASKSVTVPIDNSEAIRPYRIELIGANPRQFTIKKNDVEEQNEYIGMYLYDQYGNRIDPSNVSVKWELKTKGATGEYENYVEYEKDEITGEDVPKAMENYLVTLARSDTDIGSPQPSTPSKYTIIRVRSEFYEKDVEIFLLATVVGAGGSPLTNPTVSVVNTVKIMLQKEGGYFPPSPPAYYQVTYLGGEHGVIMEENFETVLGGEFAQKAPGVKSESGWAFNSWTVQGKEIVLEEYPIFDNVEMEAAYKYIKPLGFIEGYGDGTVRPHIGVTRAQYIKMVVTAVGGYDPNRNYIDPYGNKFLDVPNDAWYANYISYAVLIGLAEGYDDGTFRPNNPIKRTEAAKILYLAIPEIVASVEKGDEFIDEIFSDIKYGDWFAEYVETLYYLKVIGGYTDGTFRPGNDVTRAEAVKMIVLLSELAPSNKDLEMIKMYIDSPFRDLSKDSWAYAYVLRAAGIA